MSLPMSSTCVDIVVTLESTGLGTGGNVFRLPSGYLRLLDLEILYLPSFEELHPPTVVQRATIFANFVMFISGENSLTLKSHTVSLSDQQTFVILVHHCLLCLVHQPRHQHTPSLLYGVPRNVALDSPPDTSPNPATELLA